MKDLYGNLRVVNRVVAMWLPKIPLRSPCVATAHEMIIDWVVRDDKVVGESLNILSGLVTKTRHFAFKNFWLNFVKKWLIKFKWRFP